MRVKYLVLRLPYVSSTLDTFEPGDLRSACPRGAWKSRSSICLVGECVSDPSTPHRFGAFLVLFHDPRPTSSGVYGATRGPTGRSEVWGDTWSRWGPGDVSGRVAGEV